MDKLQVEMISTYGQSGKKISVLDHYIKVKSMCLLCKVEEEALPSSDASVDESWKIYGLLTECEGYVLLDRGLFGRSATESSATKWFEGVMHQRAVSRSERNYSAAIDFY